MADRHTKPERVGLPPLSTDAAFGTFLIGTLGDSRPRTEVSCKASVDRALGPQERGREGPNGDGAIPDESEWLA